MLKSMDYPIVMWEIVLPRKGIRMPRKVNRVGVFPQSHLAGIFLLKSCSTIILDRVSLRRKGRDIHRVI
jgi:hypothetical protein